MGDVAHVRVELVDSAGTVVPTANSLVRFSLTGAGTVALDNGDLRDLEPYRPEQRHAFNGRGLAILRAARPGTLALTATADGLRSMTVSVIVAGSPPQDVIPPAR
jgi:beta-galactosidase